MDQTTLDRINLLHPKIRTEVEQIYINEVVPALTGKARCRFAFTLRTFKEQAELYAQGRTKPGKVVTKAKPGQSYHNYGLAFDIVLLVDRDGNGIFESAAWDTKTDFDADLKADWMEIVNIYKRHGYKWGGDWTSFKDYPHLEKTFGYTWQQLYAKYDRKEFITGTTYVRI